MNRTTPAKARSGHRPRPTAMFPTLESVLRAPFLTPARRKMKTLSGIRRDHPLENGGCRLRNVRRNGAQIEWMIFSSSSRAAEFVLPSIGALPATA